MMATDETKEFIPVRIAVLTVSDSRGPAEDRSGDTLVERLTDAGHVLAARTILPDERAKIAKKLRQWVADPAIDVIISTGGTGLTGRDITPEAMQPLFDKQIEGFAAVFHRVSFDKIGLSTMQSRACAGVANGTFIFCLPGSGGAVRDGWSVIGPQLDAGTKPCNLVEIMPRLTER